MLESQLISKVLDEQNFYELNKSNITERDFTVLPDVYTFVKDYVREYGNTPDYRTVVAKFKKFDYYPEVHDSFGYLCKQMKATTAKREAISVLEMEAGKKFNSLNGTDFVDWLYGEAQRLKNIAGASSSLGTNFATNGVERLQKYEDSKEQRTFSYIPTPYPTLTKGLGGGFELGDYILVSAYTNRGKSWIASQIATVAWENDFGVLYYSPELSKEQQEFRFDTIIGHFDNVKVRRGKLDNEDEYKSYLEKFDETNEVPFIIKTMEDLPKGLTPDIIEADLLSMENIGLVVIDGFNLMNHGKGGRDGMAQTSRRLRQLFGRHKVAGLVVHQTPTAAEKENMGDDEIGTRQPVPPRLDQYSETVATIQDPATILTFDQHDGVAKLMIAKAREPVVGQVLDLRCNFNFGYITEATPVDYF